jgi:hypothetical protein
MRNIRFQKLEVSTVELRTNADKDNTNASAATDQQKGRNLKRYRIRHGRPVFFRVL